MFRRFLKQLDDRSCFIDRIPLKDDFTLVGKLVIHAEKHYNSVFYGLFDCLYRSSVNRMDAEKGNQ